MRASDEDRQRTVDELRRHCAAGRIDVDEYASRVERALGASTLEELDGIRADLPMMRVPEPVGGGIWAGSSPARLPAELPRGGGPDGGPAAGSRTRVVAALVAAITVAVVLGAIVVGLVAEWAWALVLIAGWAAGVVQGRLAREAKRRS